MVTNAQDQVNQNQEVPMTGYAALAAAIRAGAQRFAQGYGDFYTCDDGGPIRACPLGMALSAVAGQGVVPAFDPAVMFSGPADPCAHDDAADALDQLLADADNLVEEAFDLPDHEVLWPADYAYRTPAFLSEVIMFLNDTARWPVERIAAYCDALDDVAPLMP